MALLSLVILLVVVGVLLWVLDKYIPMDARIKQIIGIVVVVVIVIYILNAFFGLGLPNIPLR